MADIPEEFQTELDGHIVDARRLDEFYNASDGSRVTDEQWDESRDRTAESIEDLKALGFDYVGDIIPEGHEYAEVPEESEEEV